MIIDLLIAVGIPVLQMALGECSFLSFSDEPGLTRFPSP